MVEALLISAVIALILLPPSKDPAIIIKQHQQEGSFGRGFVNAVLLSLLLWAAIAFIVWIVFFRS